MGFYYAKRTPRISDSVFSNHFKGFSWLVSLSLHTKSRSAYMVHYDCFDQVFTTTMMSFYVPFGLWSTTRTMDGGMGVSFFVQPISKQQFCPQKSQPLLLAEGSLISKSFSLWLKSQKEVLNHSTESTHLKVS